MDDHHQHHHESMPAAASSAHAKQSDHAEHGAHDKHAGHGAHGEMFQRLFWISLLLTVPIVVFSQMVQDWFGYSIPSFPGQGWIAPVLGVIVFIYGGRVFLEGGLNEIRSRRPGMMLLISMAIVVAFVASAASTLGWLDLEFWWELGLLITIMLLGHWLEMRAIGQARGALTSLAALLPDEAERISGDRFETVPVAALILGDVVLVRPGQRIPADGVVAEGRAELDESMITGESRPVERTVGDRVAAGTVVGGSSLRVRVNALGEATALAGIQRLVADAQNARSRAQALADRFAGWLFFVALGSGIATFVIWTALGRIDDAITRTVTVLVISCPHALGLAIPLVIALSTSLAAKEGILVKDRLALERMRLVDLVLFDKTGTLTRGAHIVTDVSAIDGDREALLGLAAAVESDSEHPLAKAIVAAARRQGAALPTVQDFRSDAGRGVQASIDGSLVAVGGPAMIREAGATIPDALAASTTSWAARGAAVLHVMRDGKVIGALALEDEVRPESARAVAELQAHGIAVGMMTGDARAVAEGVGKDLKIDRIFAEVLPENKVGKVEEEQRGGHVVAMVGDGVNDAPALARADVGIAIGAGTDVAIESAGIILASSDPRLILSIRTLSSAAHRKMIQNLGWATGYNLIAIPLAAGALAPVGFNMPPAIGALLMSLSTIVVALNAQLLRRTNLRAE